MKNLPILEILKDSNIIRNSFIELFMAKDIDQVLEKMRFDYNHALLSNFEKILNDNDERNRLLSNKYYMNLQEDKFIGFFIDIFKNNSDICIIKTDFFSKDYDLFLPYLNSGIDIKFQYLLFHQYIKFHNKKNRYFIIKDIELLKLFIIFGLREQWINDFFIFPKDEICLINNYDQLFPMFFKNNYSLEKYDKIAKLNKIFLINKVII